jgi:hypothetical protein
MMPRKSKNKSAALLDVSHSLSIAAADLDSAEWYYRRDATNHEMEFAYNVKRRLISALKKVSKWYPEEV